VSKNVACPIQSRNDICERSTESFEAYLNAMGGGWKRLGRDVVGGQGAYSMSAN